MPPLLALLLTFAFIAFVFHRDAREKTSVSPAIWLPIAWFFLLGSRYFTHWLATLGIIPIPSINAEEGSALDRLVFLGLVLAGVRVLAKRRITLREVIRHNRWIFIFLIYGFLAILWSDYPGVSFKRWIKVLGHPVMALIVLTEPDPQQAMCKLMKRSAFLILPLSILFLKYYPELGRGFDRWTGQPFNRGITLDKNALGYDCMILGGFFVWRLLGDLGRWKSRAGKEEIIFNLGFLAMAGWLLIQANSKTPLLSLILAVATMMVLGFRFVPKRHFGAIVAITIAFLVFLEMGLGLYSTVLTLLGRDATLTDRTLLWEELLKFDVNPLLGTGFECFWLGPRMDSLSGLFHFLPNQAHNGYLETYLNLGLLGVLALLGVILASFRKIQKALLTNLHWARFRMGFLIAIVVYNWTEASFTGLHLVWFVFYLIALEYPAARVRSRAKSQPSATEHESLLTGEPALTGGAA